MNFAYGVIVIVGVLAAISLVFIVASPDDIIKPKSVSFEKKDTICTADWNPVCGVDGMTYSNMCELHANDVRLDHEGECISAQPKPVKQISVNPHILPKIATIGDVLLVEVEFRDDYGNIINHVNYDISATQDEDMILSEPGSHRHPGKHPIHETSILGESAIEIKVILQGLGHGDQISEPKGMVTTMTVTPNAQPKAESSIPLTVSIPEGVAVPGCEETRECYLPYDISIAVDTTVTWSNDDTAVHTVTSGKVPIHDELFDSGLILPGDSFDITFADAGTFDYYCIVHPWMTGIVSVS